jgi:hypothetical protein
MKHKSCELYRVNVYNIAIYFSLTSNSLLYMAEAFRELCSIRTLEAVSIVVPANDLGTEHCLMKSSEG